MKIYEPHPLQQQVHQALEEDGVRYVVVVSGRQGGKTKIAEAFSIASCINNKDVLVWIVSPTFGQCKKMFRNVDKLIRKMEETTKKKFVTKRTSSAGDIAMQFKNGSRLEFVSAAAEENLRGSSVDYLILDEAAQISNETVSTIILPTLSVTGKRVLVTSTPKGKNWLHDWYLDGQNPDKPSIKSFHWTTYDNPHLSKDFVDDFKKSFAARAFDQEILAKFVDAGGVFHDLFLSEPSTETESCFAGIDIGITKDAAVVHILDMFGKTVHVERITGSKANRALDIKQRIANTLRKYNVSKALIEVNNQGIVFAQDLEDSFDLKGVIEEFTTSNSSKCQIIEQLVHALEECKTTVIAKPEQLLKELELFSLDFTPTGKITYSGEGNSHDDHVIAFALAWECFERHGGRRKRKPWNPDMMIHVPYN